MIDLSTTYMGLYLKNPVVASASPLCDSVDKIRLLEDHGIAAVVLPSLFEEQLILESESVDADLSRGTEAFPESSSFLPEIADYNLGPDGYLELIRRAKKSVSIPVIASLNGVTPGCWVRYAREMEQAGADAIELNIYSLVTDSSRTASEVEKDYCTLVRKLRENLRIPIAVKISHFFSAIANFAGHLDTSGANALVLFNRFYQPDLDINRLEVVPSLTLSNPTELLLRLHRDLWPHRRGHRCDGRRPSRRRRLEIRDGRRARGHDDVRAPAKWRRASRHCFNRDRPMDGGTRIRLHHPDARQHEPAKRARSRDLRTRQLHARFEFLHAACSGPLNISEKGRQTGLPAGVPFPHMLMSNQKWKLTQGAHLVLLLQVIGRGEKINRLDRGCPHRNSG